MGILLWVVGAMALFSGGFKLRTRVRATVGTSRVAAAEALLGALAALASGAGLARVRPLAWALVVATLGLVVVSSLVHVRALAHFRQSRDASAEARLRSYVATRTSSR